MPCNGNSSEYCGGPNRLDMYSSGDGAVKSPTSTSSASSSTSVSPTLTSLPSGYSYKGCYVDNANGRILSSQNPDSQTLTVESCVSSCVSQGFNVAGMEYSSQCFCGNAITNNGTLAAQDSDCNMPCSGNSAENCGAGNRMSIYSNSTLKIYAVPTTQKTDLPGSWEYQGCISENTTTRVFMYQIILANNNSAENCLTQCSNFGYMSGGMEYGRECYCGDASDLAAHNSGPEPEADCNIPCTGNATYLCGGGNRISYYTWTGTPLYTWHQPQGILAGAYEFLIGGVVVPLITAAAINGKVTFVEKWGTGPPNSTGTYELDLSEINNFTAAWRPLHVKTDVFCSASLTLPDKAGRQINIGGWSEDSTYGIRLYTPSGSPGVPGTTDWQENYNELALQAGRWYPSAMVMANGSILVVGGESGSNGPPVPSLELLPKVGGTFYCDWLNRTDPYNLYPFLVVLPSGGIFVVYYNEARILDEASFETTKTLPNLPGSVNNFLSGRTYPFEGTTVILPQKAPYTDPLTILVCGGSNPGAAVALDNCVSTQPEVADPKWTLERMPSQRVMSCIAALPDGTYLILNGAKQGTAGFGLATDPNLGAVLYDPSLPVGSRFSIMANTPVARLYHSEAILLQDGRVLVSGSDPEDGVHPQEYRNEVFMPPYLLANKTQPKFTITNKDWAYGQSITINVQLFQGTTGTMKVSLMGADASTHGNSMGQRTFFPAFTCSGNSCTITAPPNAHTCPPGWFQLFVLDGPTPSHSTYVRIGGDPGQIGNWPNLPDFQPLPGV